MVTQQQIYNEYENEFEGIEFASFINKYAAYFGDARHHLRKLIGVFDTVEQAVAARRAAMKLGMKMQARYETR